MTREPKTEEAKAPADGWWTRMKARFARSSGTPLERSGDRSPGDAERLAQPEARSMMGNLLEFADTRIEDVLVPRADVVAIAESATLQELMQRFAEANHSRLPVYRETLDDLSGMIHIKDFVNLVVKFSTQKPRRRAAKTADAETAPPPPAAFRASDLKKTIKQSGLVRELLFVPASMRASDLLVKMQATHMHMAVVVDEYGGTDGLVTIEDLVEIIVGDIADEHDTTEGMIRDAGNHTYIADARVPIDEVEALLGLELLPADEEESADTLGGLIFAMIGRVPSRGEIVRHASGLEFEVAESDPRRVKKIRIHLRKDQEKPAAGPPSG